MALPRTQPPTPFLGVEWQIDTPAEFQNLWQLEKPTYI